MTLNSLCTRTACAVQVPGVDAGVVLAHLRPFAVLLREQRARLGDFEQLLTSGMTRFIACTIL